MESERREVFGWVETMCDRYPDAMERLLTRPFGNMQQWMTGHGGTVTEQRGCLVGSVGFAILEARGLGDRRIDPGYDNGSDFCHYVGRHAFATADELSHALHIGTIVPRVARDMSPTTRIGRWWDWVRNGGERHRHAPFLRAVRATIRKRLAATAAERAMVKAAETGTATEPALGLKQRLAKSRRQRRGHYPNTSNTL